MSNVDKDSIGKNSVITQPDEMMEGNTPAQKEDEDKKNVNAAKKEGDTPDSQKGDQETEDYTEGSTAEKPKRDKVDIQSDGTM